MTDTHRSGRPGPNSNGKSKSKSLARVVAALAAAGLPDTTREMPGSTRTAAEAAAAIGCDIDQIAKSVVLVDTARDAALMFVTAGGRQVDPDRAGALAGTAPGRADAAFVRARTGFAIGGVAPIGLAAPVRAWIDPRLFDFAAIWPAAGTPRHVFRIAPADLQRMAGAVRAPFTARASS